MNISTLQLGVFGLMLANGFRHGIDWDHIAAITSLTGADSTKKTRLWQSFLYILGHAMVIIVLGLAAVLLGLFMPNWVDSVMEPFVGATLILLGLYLLYSIITDRKDFKMLSRWMLLARLFQAIKHKIRHKTVSKSLHEMAHDRAMESRSAFLIGCIHGVGAETPTQLVLFLTVAGVSGKAVGTLLVLGFVIGLLVSNTLIALLTTFGFENLKRDTRYYMAFGFISAVFSIIIGLIFLTGKGSILPTILAG